MQPLRQFLIRMRLDTQCLSDTQHLEQERQVSALCCGVLIDDGLREVSFWSRGEEFGEFGAGWGVGCIGREGVVGTHPKLKARASAICDGTPSV